ncbi:hypothetical protein WJX77_005285 [Trebouxia sp. C0004]
MPGTTSAAVTAAPGGRLTYLKSFPAKLLLRCSESRQATTAEPRRFISLALVRVGRARIQARTSPAPLLSLQFFHTL